MIDKNTNIIIGTLIAVVVVVVAFGILTTPEDRSFGERIGDAADRLDDGVDDAARELEDRTPAQRIGDEIEDATDGNSN
jgi:hypothetical protein